MYVNDSGLSHTHTLSHTNTHTQNTHTYVYTYMQMMIEVFLFIFNFWRSTMDKSYQTFIPNNIKQSFQITLKKSI